MILRKEGLIIVMPKSKFYHFTLEDRKLLSRLLDENTSFRKIARIIGCVTSSITNEIKKHRIFKDFSWGTSKRVCHSDRLIKAPFVCNGCDNLSSCRKSKYFYDPIKAHEEYLKTLKDSRSGIKASKEGIDYLNKLLTPLIKDKGQTIDHILLSNDVGVSRSTLYRYINDEVLQIKNIDLKRRVRYSKHRKKKASEKVNKAIKAVLKGRKYLDFLAHIKSNPKASIVEMDTVIGKKDEGYCILTFILRKSNFMLGFLLENKYASEVVKVFDYLEKKLGKARFMSVFNIILTDNGTEFAYTDKLEANDRKIQRCHIFYCDPRASQQKGKCEKNHEYIRYFFPSGTSFSDLDQDKVTLMFSQINSVKRKELGNKCPFELLSKGQLNDMKKLGYKHIPPQDVILSSKLFK